MLPESVRITAAQFQLKETLSQRLTVNPDAVLLYQEFGSFLSELFRGFSKPGSQIIASAPCLPEIALSCDKADIQFVKADSGHFSDNGFEEIKKQVKSTGDIIYLSNPNRLSGTTFSLAQLKLLADLVKEGLLIVDEFYHDFSKLTALSLLKSHNNLIILRPFENWAVSQDSESGFAIASDSISNRAEFNSLTDTIDRFTAQKCLETVLNSGLSEKEVEKIHSRSLLVAKELTRIGIKCRITPTDFILLQFPQNADTLKLLADENFRIDQIEGSTGKQSLFRYRITNSDRDLRFIEVLSRHSKLPVQPFSKNRITTAPVKPNDNTHTKSLFG